MHRIRICSRCDVNLEKKGIEGIMRKNKKKTNSILIQSLRAEPRPGQPLFSVIVLSSAILDFLRIILNSFLCLLVICILSIVTVGIISWTKLKPEYDEYMRNAEKTVEATTPDTFRYNETTILYYQDGSKMTELSKNSDTVYLPYDQIPPNVVNAFVAIEDRTFWENPGIDIKSIVKVIIDAVVSKGENIRGASTITQQLARSVFLSNGVSMDRKFQEIAISLELTEKYSKEQIMEFYVNNVFFANGYYGIEAAAQGYFSKPASELTLSETAYLCAIPNSPSRYNPYNDKDRAVDRRDLILDAMYEVGFISWEDMEQAKDEEIKINELNNMAGGYEVTYAADCAIRSFMELNGFQFQYHFESEEDRDQYRERYHDEYEKMRKELYEGGYRIYTSIDRESQEKIQKIVDQFVSTHREKNADDLQAAAVLSDEKGQIIAVIGGVSGDGFGLNRAYQSFRQPGSAIKPLVDYTPALENGYTADTLVKNISIKDAHQKEADRINYGRSYQISELPGQKVTLRHALEKSLNGVAYVLMDDLGVGNTVPYLEKMQFSNIVPDDYTLSASLGGLTYGVSPVEMSGGYACLANDGVYNEPSCLVKIVNRYGKEIFQKKAPEMVYTAASAIAMKDLLEGVMVRGTGAGLGWYQKTEAKAYVKTGTTNDQKDGWMCGWTEDGDGEKKVLSVWVGCDMPKPLSGLWGSTWSGQLWVDSMLAVTDVTEYVETEFEYVEY